MLGRPMVLAGNRAKQVQWTNVYQDALVRTPSPAVGDTGPRVLHSPGIWVGHWPRGTGGDTGPRVPHIPGVQVGTPSPGSHTAHAPISLARGVTPLCCPPPVLGPGASDGPWDTLLLLQGLGLVVTGTLPVFNLTEDSSDRKVGDWLPPPACTGSPRCGAVAGWGGCPNAGCMAVGGGHWHPWGAACSAYLPWGVTRGDCHPQDPRRPWLALQVQWGRPAAASPWGGAVSHGGLQQG